MRFPPVRLPSAPLSVYILAMIPLIVLIPVIAHTPDAPTLDRSHPIITEVLYAVPPREQGDADQDGTRQATGDEFIELFNASDKPINLAGYRLIDGLPTKGKAAADTKSHIDFTLPQATLAPGQCAVIFNGFGASPKGNVGDKSAAKPANDNFHGALVFTMQCENQYQALSNANDMVVLLAPDGTALQCVRWDNREDSKAPNNNASDNKTSDNKTKKKSDRNTAKQTEPADKAAAEPARITQDAPKSSGSVTLQSLEGAFIPHIDTDATLFSPGRYQPKQSQSQPSTTKEAQTTTPDKPR